MEDTISQQRWTASEQRWAASTVFKALPWIIMLAGTALFLVSYRADSSAERAETELAQTVALDGLESSMSGEFERHADLLFFVGGLFGANNVVDRAGFATFIDESEVFSRSPELLAVEWAPLVLPDELDDFVATVRSQETIEGRSLDDFAVQISGDPEYHVVVTYVEPLLGNEGVLGLDLASENDRHAAVKRARETGEVAATPPLDSLYNEASTAAVRLVLPVDGEGRIGGDRFEGVVLSVFDVDLLVTNRIQSTTPFVLADRGLADGAPEPAIVVHRTAPDTQPSAVTRSFAFAGRQWEISLGEQSLNSASTWALLLRSIPTLVAAAATALVVHTLSRHNERAERRALELTAEVHEKNEELTRSNEWLESFTRVASHDLRSPLRAVNSLVGFIREDHPDLDEDAVYNLNRIEQRVGRMNTLIDDLLTLARVSDASEKVSTISFESLVSEVLETVDLPPGFTVGTAFSGPETGELAAVQFKTCVQNLVDNAIKHHDREDGHVMIDVAVSQTKVMVKVSDDGPGIPEQYLVSIFEPFRRLKPDDETPGSGIGLTAILRTAETNRGGVVVDSVQGDGTTFTLSWPLGARRATISEKPEAEDTVN